MDVPDEVRKQLDIEAPIQRVWDALTTPEGLLAWFPTEGARIDLRPGGTLSLVWADDADEGVVDAVEPPHRFVFRWRPAGSAAFRAFGLFFGTESSTTTRSRSGKRCSTLRATAVVPGYSFVSP